MAKQLKNLQRTEESDLASHKAEPIWRESRAAASKCQLHKQRDKDQNQKWDGDDLMELYSKYQLTEDIMLQ